MRLERNVSCTDDNLLPLEPSFQIISFKVQIHIFEICSSCDRSLNPGKEQIVEKVFKTGSELHVFTYQHTSIYSFLFLGKLEDHVVI